MAYDLWITFELYVMCEINEANLLKSMKMTFFCMLHPIYLLPTLYIKINHARYRSIIRLGVQKYMIYGASLIDV